MRYQLLINVIFKYGFENSKTIKFANMVEKFPNRKLYNAIIKTIASLWGCSEY